MSTDSPAHGPLAELLALMHAGDMHALDVITRAYGARLLAVAKRRCHAAHDAEDAVQQALLAARTSMTTFRGDGSPLAWLSTLVSRSCARLNAKRTREPLDDDRELECGCEDPETIASQRELEARLEGALMGLSRTDRLAFLLSVEGYTSVEIAEKFSLSHDAVRSRLKRARKVLRSAADLDDTLSNATSTASVKSNKEPADADQLTQRSEAR
ncbi:MAG: RNA polymerase sigma factor [Myxococcales bacterium]|nr:RNA polymerase sigma factor [Myxococcales bacterium]